MITNKQLGLLSDIAGWIKSIIADGNENPVHQDRLFALSEAIATLEQANVLAELVLITSTDSTPLELIAAAYLLLGREVAKETK